MSDTSASDVQGICRRAQAAFPALVAAGRSGRARLLHRVADELEHDREHIEATAVAETHLSPQRLAGELNRTVAQARLFASVLDDGAYLDAAVDHATLTTPDLRRMLTPIGAVAVFGASNFPLAFSVPGGDTVSALAAGCPVVVKAHPGHPLTSLASAEAIGRALRSEGFADDTVALVWGVDAGRDLVLDENIHAVGFTGSTAVGRLLYNLASNRAKPIPFFGELGSVNPVIVTPAAALERPQAIGRLVATSIAGSAGQLCTKPNLVFVPAGVGDALVREIADGLGATPPIAMLNPAVQSRFDDSFGLWANSPRVSVLLAGDGTTSGESPRLAEVPVNALGGALLDEAFGPAAVLVRYDHLNELPSALLRLGGQLTASLLAEPSDDIASLVDVMGSIAGRVVFDDVPTGVAVTWAMTHGGPYPATTSSAHTSVGSSAITRWLRPVTYQNAPAGVLPAELRDAASVAQRVDGVLAVPAR